MEETEAEVYKNLVTFCKSLPKHVEKWRTGLQDAVNPVKWLVNKSEQLRMVVSARIEYIEDFDDAQNCLKFQILNGIEEDFKILRDIVEKLINANSDFRNKLILFENSTLNLDWDDSSSSLIGGTGCVPRLTRLLEAALEYSNFFMEAQKAISLLPNWMEEKSVEEFRKAFDVSLEDERVNYLLAITQYVDNENGIN